MNGIIPGSVLGMILLFLALLFKLIDPEKIKNISKSLTQNMALFFIHVGVGVMATTYLIMRYITGILIASVVSTVIVIVTVALVQQKLERWKR